ncbi:MAG: flavodoxin family protein [Armatimonadota bacterium]
MHAVILHGGAKNEAGLEAVHTMLCEALQGAGWTVETLRIAEMTIHPCSGCFNCWLKTPGECTWDDDGRQVARALVQCDLRVFLSPVSFGGYNGLLKTALDRIIPTISPLFTKIHGEMRHKMRYPHSPRALGVGWQQQPNADSADIFAQVVQRNMLNMRPPAWGSGVFTSMQTADEQHALLAGLLHQVEVQ